MFKKKRSDVAEHAISELLRRFPNMKGTLWMFRHFLPILKKSASIKFGIK